MRQLTTLALALFASVATGMVFAETTSRVSVDSEGNQLVFDGECEATYCGVGSGGCSWECTIGGVTVDVCCSWERPSFGAKHPAISGDGRFLAFSSPLNNLVADDTNVAHDVFLHDRQTGKTRRVSLGSLEQEGNASSEQPAISGGGRFVVFESRASNLVVGDTNEEADIFLRDSDRDVVNEHVSFEPKASSFRSLAKRGGCRNEFVGRFRFDALLVNESGINLERLQIPVAKLTRGNGLLTDMGLIGPNGEFPVPERDAHSDAVLEPGESITVALVVCLRDRKPFKLYVDVADDSEVKAFESVAPQAEFRFIVGLDGDDTLKGTGGGDMLIGFDGDDKVRGKGGDDLILAGRGNDDLRGGSGDDRLSGGKGQDAVRGDSGDDLILGGRGDDDLCGGRDDDELRGNGGNVRLRGNEDDDLLIGGSGNDALDGGNNVDICKGGSGENKFRRCEL